MKLISCPKCGTQVSATAQTCPSCGEVINKNPKKVFCKHCGAEMEEGVKFCPSCGGCQTGNAGAQSNTTTVIVNESKSNGLGTAGFVLAILSFFLCWAPFVNFVIWFLGALFSFIGMFKKPRGLAIAGFVLSFLGVILLLTVFGSLLAFVR